MKKNALNEIKWAFNRQRKKIQRNEANEVRWNVRMLNWQFLFLFFFFGFDRNNDLKEVESID